MTLADALAGYIATRSFFFPAVDGAENGRYMRFARTITFLMVAAVVFGVDSILP